MKKTLLLLISAALLTACASSSEKSGGQKDDGVKTNSKAAIATAECFMAMDYSYEKLLTKEDVGKHAVIDEASYEMEVSPTKGTYGDCTYSWASDRPAIPIEVSGMRIDTKDDNFVRIKGLNFYNEDDLELYNQESALALFDRGYKKLSQSEYEEEVENLKNNYSDEGQLNQAIKFLDARMQLTYKPVENLGDRAYWKWDDRYGISLHVLTGPVQFTVETKISAGAETSLEAAVNFAREVLAKCD